MLLTKIKTCGAYACLAVIPLMLHATQAQARYIPSELSGDMALSEVQSTLVRELAVQSLAIFGIGAEEAAVLVDAVFAAEIQDLLRDECNGGLVDMTALPEGRWHAAGERYAMALNERGVLSIDEDHVSMFASRGKVVGFNWKGLLLVVLPVIVIGAVLVASGSGGAALLAVGVVVGLALVLFVEPEWLFGAG